MMELDEAIKHCKEKAKELSDKAYSQWGKNMTEEQAYDCNECAREHRQLAEWLTDYKRLKSLVSPHITPILNEIIMATIEWIKENDIVPEIIFYPVCGGIHLILKLCKGGNHMSHEFYIPGGVLSVENWKRGHCDIGLDIFLENAKKQFAIQERIERDE